VIVGGPELSPRAAKLPFDGSDHPAGQQFRDFTGGEPERLRIEASPAGPEPLVFAVLGEPAADWTHAYESV
jgi:hypothetical protein